MLVPRDAQKLTDNRAAYRLISWLPKFPSQDVVLRDSGSIQESTTRIQSESTPAYLSTRRWFLALHL